jgi:hypothetical protein
MPINRINPHQLCRPEARLVMQRVPIVVAVAVGFLLEIPRMQA